MGDAPGNCRACADFHLRLHRLHVARSKANGRDSAPASTPCGICPKFKLMPPPDEPGGSDRSYWGLHPKNVLAWELYCRARRNDLRVGMEGVLVGTLTPGDARMVVDEYAGDLSGLARRGLLDKMLVVDEVATRVMGERENREREAERKKAERLSKAGRG